MRQKVQIVNENDEIIGHKFRDEIDYAQDIYRVAALWLTNSKGEVLIAQRKFTKDKDPGKWGPAAAGTMEEGETYEKNVYKEAEEELGVTGVQFQFGPKAYYATPRRCFCQWYTTCLDWPVERFVPQEEEVEQVKWVAAEHLKLDVAAHPENYTPSMRIIVTSFL